MKKRELITKESLFVMDKESGEMVLSENAIETIINIEQQMKELDKSYTKYRKAILEGMEAYGLVKCDTEDLLVTYVEPTERVSLDQTKLKEDYADVYFKCQKVKPVKSSVRITVR